MRFDACAQSYDAYAVPQRAFAERVADFIHVAHGAEVLELGAGTGALTARLCAHGATVHATDASLRMVALGKASVPSARWSRLDAFTDALPVAALQVSSGLLQWAGDPFEILRRWKESLQTRGRMVHALPCEPCLREWRELVPEGPVHWRDQDTWTRLFEQAGLKVLRKELWTDSIFFPAALDMIRALHRSGVTGRARLGPGRLRQAVRQYQREHQQGGGVAATWAWLAIEAAP